MVVKKTKTGQVGETKVKTKVVISKRPAAKTLTRKVEQKAKSPDKIVHKGVVAKTSLVKAKPVRSLELKTKVQTAEGWKRGVLKRSTSKK